MPRKTTSNLSVLAKVAFIASIFLHLPLSGSEYEADAQRATTNHHADPQNNTSMKNQIEELITAKAKEKGFSGIVSVSSPKLSYQFSFGHRDRANRIVPNSETRFGIASGTKGFTALAVAILIQEGVISMETTAHSILGDQMTNLHPKITVKQLLEHTSGIGDHYDEEDIGDDVDSFTLSIPVQNLNSPLDYIPLIEEKAQKFTPGEQAVYSNGGYVVLSMIVEVVSKTPFHEFVEERIFKTAGMTRSGFFRSDSLPSNTALGYLSEKDGLQTNLFKLPIIGSGDGGAYTTQGDMQAFWVALKAGEIVELSVLEPFIVEQNKLDGDWYGYGFWIDKELERIVLVGYDAGVSFYSSTSKDADDVITVISNTSNGAWPVVKLLRNKIVPIIHER